jgi:predicted AlkP superfamily phosphohydrolase/phosphomutase
VLIQIAFTAVVGASALLLLISRFSRLAAFWGALWGVLLGACLLAPMLLRVHYLRPVTASQWLVLDVALAVIFATIGFVIAFVVSAPVSVWLIRRGISRDATDGRCAKFTALTVPFAYVAFSAWIEWRNFSRAPAAGYFATAVMGAVVSGAVLFVVTLVFARTRGAGAKLSGLRRLAVAAAMFGFVVLFWRAPPASGPAVSAQPLKRLDATAGKHPLLVIGFDGANWETIQPLLRQGRLPAIERLLANGTHGDVHAQWPPYWSMAAWGAMLTGHSNDEIGVHEDLSATAPGLPAFEVSLTLDPALDPVFYAEFVLTSLGLIRPEPQLRTALRRPPIWELLSVSGAHTAVVRFPLTYPADDGADLIVSDRMSTDLWNAVGVRSADIEHVVSPASAAARVSDWMSRADGATDGIFRAILPDPPAQPMISPATGPAGLLRQLLGLDDIAHSVIGLGSDPVSVLKEVLISDQRTLEVGERVIRSGTPLDVAMVFIGGFDLACHAFWRYRFPEAYPTAAPSAEDVARFGPVIDRYMEFLDKRIANLIAAYPSMPNVVLVSDHGLEASLANPLWFGAHSPRGVFIAAGPDIPSSSKGVNVSYYDVAPTVLALQELEKPHDMVGNSVISQPRREADVDPPHK